jgi:serine/threonine protein kinase
VSSDHCSHRGQVNVLISDAGHAQIADFGLAIMSESTLARMTVTSIQAGSPAWMSPQRISVPDHRRDTSDDVYAYGCLSYLVTPSRPHDTSLDLMPLAVDHGSLPLSWRECDRHHPQDCQWTAPRSTTKPTARALL